MAEKKFAVVIGAGPAGLTAAYELLTKTDILPIVIERSPTHVGGISRTVNYKGNRIDVGGHRFFSKSDLILKWWSRFLPIQQPPVLTGALSYRKQTYKLPEGITFSSSSYDDNVFHFRPRKSRILFEGKLYDYPISISVNTFFNLGATRVFKILLTYLYAAIHPRKPERTLEDFFINRFGTELYRTFFKTYTEKVWGVSCEALPAEWGAQRVKGLSIYGAISHAVRKIIGRFGMQNKTETSLIEQFLYPTFGPGQLWEKVAREIERLGGKIHMGTEITGVSTEKNLVKSVATTGKHRGTIACDFLLSSTDIPTLLHVLPNVPKDVQQVSERLAFRNFFTVGVLTSTKPVDAQGGQLTDTWMYIHDETIKAGRIQFFHNWSPDLVSNQSHGWMGLEYFCSPNDSMWVKSDEELISIAKNEFQQCWFARGLEILDATIVRQVHAYPSYTGAYADFPLIKRYLDSMKNLYPVGRNGMHRYNNQDHSMLAAIRAVEIIANGGNSKSSIWDVDPDAEQT